MIYHLDHLLTPVLRRHPVLKHEPWHHQDVAPLLFARMGPGPDPAGNPIQPARDLDPLLPGNLPENTPPERDVTLRDVRRKGRQIVRLLEVIQPLIPGEGDIPDPGHLP